MTDGVATGGMTKAKKALVADIILNMVALNSFGWNLDQITHTIRTMEEEGSTPKDVLNWLKDLANKEAKALTDRLNTEDVAQ